MLVKQTPIYITQIIGTDDAADLVKVAAALNQEIARIPEADRASAQISGLHGLRMGYSRTLSPAEEHAERMSMLRAGIGALRGVSQADLPGAIDRLLQAAEATEA